MDIDLAAVLADNLDFVVALFVADLGACNAAPVSLVERDTLRLLDVGSGRLCRGVAAGGIGHACPEEQQDRDRRSYNQCPYVYRVCVHFITSFYLIGSGAQCSG